MSMTEISAQSENVARYGIVVMRTAFQRPDGEGVPQIVDTRSRLARLTTQSDLARDFPEHRADGIVA